MTAVGSPVSDGTNQPQAERDARSAQRTSDSSEREGDATVPPSLLERIRWIFDEPGRTSDEKIQEALRWGVEYFDVENGHLVHIDPADGTHEVVHLSEPHPALPAGEQVPLADTYCRMVIANGETLLVTNASEEGWADDPAYRFFEFGCYLGTKVVTGSQFYGTLCFVDRASRESVDPNVDRAVLEGLAQEIGEELFRRTSEAAVEVGGDVQRMSNLLRGRVRDATSTGGWEYDPSTSTVSGTSQLGRLVGDPGTTDYDLTAALRFFPPAARERLRRAARNCLVEGTQIDVDASLIRTDEQRRWVQVRGERLVTDEGPPRLVGTVDDITARKRAERALQEEHNTLQQMYRIAADWEIAFEEKVRRMIEVGRNFLGLPYGFLTRIVDGEQRIVKARGTHALLQEGASCPLSEAYCRKTIEEDRLLTVHNAEAAGWGGDPAYEKFELGTYIGAQVRVDGELYGTICFASSVPRKEPFSEQAEMVVELMTLWIGYELSQLRSREQLQRQNDRLEQFAGVVSHDLRNPLNVAKGRLSLVREEAPLGPEMLVHLASIDDAIDRMDEIIQDVLALTQGEHSVNQEACESLSLAESARTSWDTVDTGPATLGVEENRSLYGHRGQLRRLLENLFRNAVEHAGETVTVWVGALDDGFYVEDDGPGIPASQRDAVVEEGHSSSKEGTGLGLSIVRSIVEAHGASLEIVDGRAGGARFEVRGGTFRHAEEPSHTGA
ncbi:MAG: ATP-binding protein [Salinivenus sp.]